MNEQEIKQLIDTNFTIKGKFKVNPNGVVDVDGDVECKDNFESGQLPINFGVVTGTFNVAYGGLSTFKGSPHTVGGDFVSQLNHTATLDGAPTKVGGFFHISFNSVPITNMNALPQSIGHAAAFSEAAVTIPWSENLGLLRLITNDIGYANSSTKPPLDLEHAPKELFDILMKYIGKTTPEARRAAAVQCTLELIRAGYKSNARL